MQFPREGLWEGFYCPVCFGQGRVQSEREFSLTDCSPRSEWRSIHYPKVLLDNICLFDGVKNGLQKDQIVLIEGDTILGIERKGDLVQYKGFRHFDLNGWTLLPGFIDNHVHMTSPYVITGKQNVLFRFRTRNDDYVESIL